MFLSDGIKKIASMLPSHPNNIVAATKLHKVAVWIGHSQTNLFNWLQTSNFTSSKQGIVKLIETHCKVINIMSSIK